VLKWQETACARIDTHSHPSTRTQTHTYIRPPIARVQTDHGRQDQWSPKRHPRGPQENPSCCHTSPLAARPCLVLLTPHRHHTPRHTENRAHTRASAPAHSSSRAPLAPASSPRRHLLALPLCDRRHAHAVRLQDYQRFGERLHLAPFCLTEHSHVVPGLIPVLAGRQERQRKPLEGSEGDDHSRDASCEPAVGVLRRGVDSDGGTKTLRRRGSGHVAVSVSALDMPHICGCSMGSEVQRSAVCRIRAQQRVARAGVPGEKVALMFWERRYCTRAGKPAKDAVAPEHACKTPTYAPEGFDDNVLILPFVIVSRRRAG